MNDQPRAPETAPTAAGIATAAGPSVGMLSPIRETDLAPVFPQPPAASYGTGDDVDGGLDIARIVHALRRCWLPAASVGLLLAGLLAPLPWFLLPETYEAVAWLRMRANPGSFSGAGDSFGQYLNTQLQLMRSPFVLTAALRQPEVAGLAIFAEQDDPVDWLARNLRASAAAESEVVQIGLRGPSASDVTKVVNAVVQAYLTDVVNKDKLDRLARRDVLEQKYKANMAEVRQRLGTFNNLARSLGSSDSNEVSTQRSLLLDHLATLRGSLVQLQGDLNRIDAELALIEAQSRGEIPGAGPEEGGLPTGDGVEAMVMRHPQIVELTSRLARIEEKIISQTEISARGAGDPAVRRLSAQREELTQLLDARVKALRPQIAAQVPADAERPGGGGAPALLRFRRELLVKRLEETSKEFDEVARDVTSLGNANADLEARRSEIAQLQQVTNALGVQLNESEIDLATPNRVELIEEARVPGSSEMAFRIFATFVTALAGFAVGGSLVVLLEYLRDRLAAPEQIPRRVGLRVIGSVPRVSRSAKRPNHGEIAECVDGLRAVLMQTGPEQPKVILVTSAREHEGKTTFAAQLAASFARSGSRTLLVDGDLRHPNAHLALGLDLRTGLPEVLRGEISADEAIQPTAVDGLFAVTGGVCDYASVAALARPQTPALVKHYRDSFDQVVIDAGPVLAFADVLFLGQAADAAILVTMRDVTRMPLVGKALERLRSVGIRVLGAVANGVNDANPKQLYASRSVMA